jgi:hypothetical protein
MPRISREGDDPDFACRGIGKAASGRGFLVSGCETGATRSGSHDLFVAGCGVLGWSRLTGGTCDSVTYRCDSLDCSVARLAIQQGLGILSERRVGTYPAYPFNPSSPRAVVALPLPFFYLFGRLLRRGREVSAIWRFSAYVPENLSVTIREAQSSQKSPVVGLPQGFGPYPCFLLVQMHLFMLRHGL